MHIAEGVLSVPALVTGAGVAAAGVGVGLRRLSHDCVPRAALLSAAFYVASLVHLPVGPTSVHLILNGLAGVMLGWVAFPALLTALVLQWLFFGFGGITVLGANTVCMAVPAVLCHYLFRAGLRRASGRTAFGLGFAAGALAVALGCGLLGLFLLASGTAFGAVAAMVLVAHLPVMIIEGLVTGSTVSFLRRVRPELLAQLM